VLGAMGGEWVLGAMGGRVGAGAMGGRVGAGTDLEGWRWTSGRRWLVRREAGHGRPLRSTCTPSGSCSHLCDYINVLAAFAVTINVTVVILIYVLSCSRHEESCVLLLFTVKVGGSADIKDEEWSAPYMMTVTSTEHRLSGLT